MNVLHINCVYPNGSTGRITSDLHKALREKGHSSTVLYTRKKVRDNNAICVCTTFESKINHAIANFTGLVYGGCYSQTNRIINIIKAKKPDIVHLQCINGYFVNIYRLIAHLKRSKIKTVITLHAEFMYTANCALSLGCEKWRTGCGNCPNLAKSTGSWFFDQTANSFNLMSSAFAGFEENLTVVGVCDWISNRASHSSIMKNIDIQTIYNGIDTQVFRPVSPQIFKTRLGIKSEERLIIWVTSGFTKEKGADYFFELTRKMESTGCRFAVAGVNKPENYNGDIVFLGNISNSRNLAELYSAADCSLCCSRQESYPTVLLESQCCGTPVVAFDVGGVAEAIHPEMGEVLPLGDIDAMVDAVLRSAVKKEKCTSLVDDCSYLFSRRRMQKEYLDLYRVILEKS